MFFRALTMFRFPQSMDFSGLESALTGMALNPVGPLDVASSGFVPPLAPHIDALVHTEAGVLLVALGSEERLLPASVIEEHLQTQMQQLAEINGRRPGGLARKRLREAIITDLLPRAFVKATRLHAMIDPARGVIAIDTSSRRAAESVVSHIRGALGSFPALPLYTPVSPRDVMTRWVAGDPLPDGLLLGKDCTLEDPAKTGGMVKCYRVDLLSDEIAEHIRSGRQATRVSLCLWERIAFDLDECMTVRKLRFLNAAIDALDFGQSDGIAGDLSAKLALMAGEFCRLFDLLQDTFNLHRVENDQ